MAANYLHGVETIELSNGPVPISVVKAAVIALIGTAPEGPVNELTLVQNPTDAAQFGSQLTGFTIPQALDAIFKQGAGTVLVVNVFDSTANTTQVTDEILVATENGQAVTLSNPVTAVTLKIAAATVPTDAYSVDDYGNITVLDFTEIPEGSILLATYKKLNAASVTNAQIIGEYDDETDERTGLVLYDLSYNMFGFVPKIFIAPGFSTVEALSAELIVKADKFRGRALIDAPAGTTVTEAITGRGPLGEINFYTSSKRAVLLYPMVKAYDIATDANQDRPYSQYFAGVWAATINNEGYWVSPSNHEIKGIVGVERNISAAINDASTDANLLNEKGIVTLFNSFGTGTRTWGNRSAAFPTNTKPENFLAVQLVSDVLHESVELAMLQFVDKPITNAVIDSIKQTVNAFINTLIMRGALVDGSCSYDPAKNPPTEIAAGHLTFDLVFMPPTPAERITFESFVDINLLKSLGQ